MTPRQDILNELRELSPVLANVPTDNPFRVPVGYFDALSDDISLKISEESFGEKSDTLSVPQGYFDGLASSILQKIKAEEQTELQDGTSDILTSIGNQNLFTSPTGYFETLPAMVMSQVASVNAETAALSETVAAIGNQNVFTLPVDYFEHNAERIAKLLPKTEAKLVTMQPRFKAMKYAAAAVLGLVIMVSGYFVMQNQQGTANAVSAYYSPEVMKDADQILKNQSFDEALAGVSGDEITQFLAENGTDVNAALVASTIEDGDLPSPDDYLFDESTLENFLKEKNLEN